MNAMLPLFTADAATNRSADIIAAARALAPHLAKSRNLDRRLVSNTMTLCFGGTDAEGLWTWRDAYDAIEAALVLQMRRLAPQLGRVEDAPAEIAVMLSNLTDLTLTHTRRSEEQVELDQFSTPPALAALTVAAAQVRPGDLVLEPSAGIGLIAVCAEACGATVELNELSPHRAGLLDALFPVASRTRHDAAHLADVLPSSGSYHAIVTNPPFGPLHEHLIAAVRALADGGRLAAVVPTRAFSDRGLMADLASRGRIIAAIGFPARAFAKHGTSVDVGLLVFDRGEAVAWDGAIAHHDDLPALAASIAALPPRPTAQQRTFRQVAVSALLTPRARAIASASNKLAFIETAAKLDYETITWSGEGHDVGLYQSYKVGRVRFARSNPHPSPLVESRPMASVALPAPTYRPMLPAKIVEDGLISDAQLEQVVYAGEAHSRILPGWWQIVDGTPHHVRLVPEGTAGAFQCRTGFFIGDGTGCGKGREAASIIADNMAQGRTRAVWISKNDPLLDDARRDWTAIGGAASDITPHSRWKQGEAIAMDRGILFTTYATLRTPARGDKRSRLQQLVDWLGPDFDGAVIFDESHALANAAGGSGSRGPKKASLQGQAGLALQNLLPNARVVYVSATGATEPQNLAYASRLGLWGGPEAPFNTREAFLEACDKGGVATMELIARELKAMGLYLARSLSFEGVEYEPLRHELTEDDIRIWDAWADAFQIIHTNLQEALKATGVSDEEGKSNSAQAKSAIMSAFESNKLRFFAHLLSGLKTPSLVSSIRNALEAGNSAIVQIVSTNEAVMERRLAEIPAEEWNNLAVDLTPKEYVLDYLKNAFPITVQEVIEDDEGNTSTRPLMVDGRPVVSQAALELRDNLITELACLPAVPSVLDAVLDALGPDQVAEVTGRSRRVVTRDGRRVVERRGASSARAETDAFMSGRKRVLIFSDAGGTGRSYHADLNAPNQQRRVHYMVEPGWRADNAVQGLGRSHRTNQAHPPLFRPVTTDIRGEKRFLSTIARRLDSLGALTRGERRTAGNGLFSADDNLESPSAHRALGIFYYNLFSGSATCMRLDEFQTKTGLNLLDAEGMLKESDQLPPMHTFLNRVLALRIADQNAIFDDFDAILRGVIERAAQSGQLDHGVEEIIADDLRILSDEVIRTDTTTGAETRLLRVETRVKRELLNPGELRQNLPTPSLGLYINKRSGGAAIVEFGRTTIDDDSRMTEAVRLWRPDKRQTVARRLFDESAWQEAPEPIWQATWDAEVAALSPWRTREFALVTGLLLPIWSKLPSQSARVRRLTAPDGRRWLGRVLDIEELPRLRIELGLTDAAAAFSDPADLRKHVMDNGGEVQLSNGFWLRRVRVMDTPRLEVVGGRTAIHPLKLLGCFVEIIVHTPRVFVPLGDQADAIIAKIVAKWPVEAIHNQAAKAA